MAQKQYWLQGKHTEKHTHTEGRDASQTLRGREKKLLSDTEMGQVSRETLQTYLVNTSRGWTSSWRTDTQHQEARLQSQALHVAVMAANQSVQEKQRQPLPPAWKRAEGIGVANLFVCLEIPTHVDSSDI